MAKSKGPDSHQQHPEHLIVGIGASAGGLKALQQFFDEVPRDPGVAFVVVIHLLPDRESDLATLLSRHTELPVKQVEDGESVEPNRVYVIPPDTELAVMNGDLHLIPRGKDRPWLPIDYFFRSLAWDATEAAVGVVLSGSGSDGALGLQEIRGEDGLTMAESPEAAEFSAMPQAAIDLGVVDVVGNPEELAKELLEYVEHFSHRRGKVQRKPERFKGQLDKIFVILRSQVGHDFSAYKESTALRRIDRRLGVHRIERLEDYVKYLQGNPKELDLLFRDLLIGVTSFFREPEAFEDLRERALPGLLENRRNDDPLRIWVPGCSGGEEAYSIAMVIRDVLEERSQSVPVNIFATDIDDDAIDRARRGTFPLAAQQDIGKERTHRFFKKVGDTLEVTQSIRNMLVFSTQDLIRDPPFTKLDILSCRNLMIYLKPEVQQKLIPLFHYALKPGGYLVLGASETVGNFPDLFAPGGGRGRLYKAKPNDGRRPEHVGLGLPIRHDRSKNSPPREAGRGAAAQTEGFLQRYLLRRHTPTTVFVNRKREVVYVHGSTGRYFELATGVARMDVTEMARGAIRLPLSQALRDAFRGEKLVERSGIRFEGDGGPAIVHLTVDPIREDEDTPDLFAVVFREEPLSETVLRKTTEEGRRETGEDGVAEDESDYVVSLENELAATRERLHTTVEELETTNEELKSSLEEYQSTNEELQSSNEELESSKEEMQSLNEELTTVNNELQTKNEELSRANAEMRNFLDVLDIPILFVDNQLRIKRYNQATTELVSIIESDVDRHIGQLNHRLRYDDFIDDMDDVVRRATEKERRIESKNGTPYLVRMTPYKNIDDVLEGVLVVFLDATSVSGPRSET
ncbi:MAG: chemotaxis protein CheB [Spirochaetaceae bacterium]